MSLSGCREVEELLFDYLEGNLDNQIKASVEAHLASCEKCRTELERCRSTLKLLASAKAVPPQSFVASVMTGIDSGRKSARKPGSVLSGVNGAVKPEMLPARKRPFIFRYGTVAAAVLLVAALAAGWRVLPAFMNAGMSKDEAAQYGGALTPENSAETELPQQSSYCDSAAAGGGSSSAAEDTERMLMFMAPSMQSKETDTGAADSSEADENLIIAENKASEESGETERAELSASDKLFTGSITPEQLLTQYAPSFSGKATEVVIVYTDKPITDRPHASSQVDGDGYTAFLINDSAEVIKAAESLAATLGAELYGTSGVGLVWIEIY